MILFLQPGADPLLWTWDPGLGIRARGVTCQASGKSTRNLLVWAGPGLFVKALVGSVGAVRPLPGLGVFPHGLWWGVWEPSILYLAREYSLTGPGRFGAPR